MNLVRFACVFLFLAFAGVVMAEGAPKAAAASTATVQAADAAAPAAAVAPKAPADKKFLYLAIAITMSFGCLSAAFAVAKVGAAVMGAAAEKPEIMGKAIAFVGLGEGIALFAFLIALFLYTKI